MMAPGLVYTSVRSKAVSLQETHNDFILSVRRREEMDGGEGCLIRARKTFFANPSSHPLPSGEWES